MIYLAANHSSVWQLAETHSVGWIMSPAGFRRPIKECRTLPYALDNGQFHKPGEKSKTPIGGIYTMLHRVLRDMWHLPMFAVVPDVPYDGEASLALSVAHVDTMRELFPRVPLALAVQDGMEPLSTPLHLFDWIFIGGSTKWKWRTLPKWCAAGREYRKPVHVARVNGGGPIRACIHYGAASADGTSIAYGDSDQIRNILRAVRFNAMSRDSTTPFSIRLPRRGGALVGAFDNDEWYHECPDCGEQCNCVAGRHDVGDCQHECVFVDTHPAIAASTKGNTNHSPAPQAPAPEPAE